MTPELRETALRLLGEGQSITAVAQAIGKSRQALYRAAARDPELLRAMRGDDDPAPREDFDTRPGLTPWTEPLTAGQVVEFTKVLRKARRIAAAARAAGVDMHPYRVPPSEMSKHKRELIRDFLDKLREPDPDPVADTRRALDDWLANREWPIDTGHIDAAELRELSPRAADNFEATLRARAQVLARASTSGRSRPKQSDDWEEF